ncbi:MAG: hypothetical protein ABSC90_10625 [Acidimicrobiales bacterium]
MADGMVGAHEFAVVETTGLYWRRDRVVSVAVARCDEQGRPLEQWYSLVNPVKAVEEFLDNLLPADEFRLTRVS